jgi:hypothetical protein
MKADQTFIDFALEPKDFILSRLAQPAVSKDA